LTAHEGIAFDLARVSVSYSGVEVVREVTMTVPERGVFAILGPSGSGKSTLLRTLNRMNDLVAGVRIEGDVRFRGRDLYAADVEPTAIRQQIGMVFQKPNVFPSSIFDNVAYGPRLHHHQRDDLSDLVRESLRRAALWEEVKGDLAKDARTLSGGQQQRLVVARCLALAPQAILMDEPTSALDPHSTGHIEELITALAVDCTIVLVTHNVNQARRVAQTCAVLSTRRTEAGGLVGELVEVGSTAGVLSEPKDPRTARFLSEYLD
jgi:phosphate transport system ATP-binding protein